MDTAQWATTYASVASWRVFPVRPGDKRPAYANWQADATTDAKMIEQYWPESLDRNVAVVCGEAFDAWDIEAAHLPRFQAWLDTNGYALPESPLAQTGRGGIHLLTEPTGVAGNRYLYLDGVHIGELKSTGGFIVVCPSKTEGYYRWLFATPGLAVQSAPSWLLGLLERPKTGVKYFPTRLATPEDVVAALGRLARAVTHAGEGSRNNYLYWAMRQAIEEGVPAGHAQTALTVAGNEAGLDPDEVEKTIESALVAESVAA